MSSDSDLKNTSLGIAITDPISISSIFGNPTMDEINKLLFKDEPIVESKDDNQDKNKDANNNVDQQGNSQDEKKDTNGKTGCTIDLLLSK